MASSVFAYFGQHLTSLGASDTLARFAVVDVTDYDGGRESP
jgi:hypothetical protein